MARRFRFYGKKRGHRLTGSERWGALGEAFFFAILLVVGVVGLVVMITNYIVPEWRANRHFVQTTCTVLGTEVQSLHVETETDNAPTNDDQRFRPLVHIRYVVDGRPFETKTYDIVGRDYRSRDKAERLLEPFQVDDQFVCWYDPFDHNSAVLTRGYSWWVYLFFTLPTAFLLIGLVGLVWTAISSGTSMERRAALVKRTTGVDWLESEDELLIAEDLPAVPKHKEINNSPGTALTYRLPIGTQTGWQMFSLGAVTVFWNVFALIGLAIAIRGNIVGTSDWVLTALVVPFLVFGLVLVFIFLRQLLVTSGIGMTRVEISDHPLIPGEDYELLVNQEGKLNVNSMTVLLVCEETATFRQGTDTRTESVTVWREEVHREEQFEIHEDRGFEVRARFRMSPEAMHSLTTGHNSVRWSLLVRGELQHWPDFERRFSVVVHPPRGGSES